ncbi:NnrS family protein [Simplicispira psychrophila]|uniref:NnrS family protein n=1 Tax=Simplicispira psychrophila TaxID=80882 RepID=UPI000B08D644|nr:NnrS family protein [Simplicispira psychrophila]
MSAGRTIPIQVVGGKPDAQTLAQLDRRWRPRYLLRAPHRLGFFLAMVVLLAASAWWALVQLDRVSGWLGLPLVLPPSLVHAAVMVFGFMPLFFSGFMFTAGPKWLQVPQPRSARLLLPLLLQTLGWLLWLAGGHLHAGVALAGVALATLGWAMVAALFWSLLWRSQAEDPVHARALGVALLVGGLSLAGVALGVALEAPVVARACVLTGLWGCVVVVFVTVAHRMVPFLSSDTLPLIAAWRSLGVLWLMLGAAVLEAAAIWVEFDGPLPGSIAAWWMLLRGSLELVVGTVLLWLALRWGRGQSRKNRQMVMLHLGFVWLGLSMLLAGLSQWLGLWQGAPVMGLGALHALTMGCLASLMLTMVTRVSCAHSGRATQADRITWPLLWFLQLATLLRIAAAWPSGISAYLLVLAAWLWLALMAVWALRLAPWYGRMRSDGRPG